MYRCVSNEERGVSHLKSRELALDSNELSSGLVSRKSKKQPPTLLSLAKAGNLAELNTLLYGAETGSKETGSSAESRRRVSAQKEHASARAAAAAAAAATSTSATSASAKKDYSGRVAGVHLPGNSPRSLLESSGTGLQVQERPLKAGIDVNMRYVALRYIVHFVLKTAVK
jgi:septal ring factor EnvC (AmiA/AmiB activator)